MSFKIILFTVTTWMVLSLLCGVCEGALMSTAEGAASVSNISTLAQGDFASWTFWKTIGNMITFNFPYLFTGPYVILQWVFFVPLVLAFGIMMGGFILAHIPLIGRGT